MMFLAKTQIKSSLHFLVDELNLPGITLITDKLLGDRTVSAPETMWPKGEFCTVLSIKKLDSISIASTNQTFTVLVRSTINSDAEKKASSLLLAARTECIFCVLLS